MKRLLFCLLIPVLCLGNDPYPPLGLWSWKQSSFETSSARESLFQFCETEGIVHVDQHVSIKKAKNGDYAVQNAEALRQLVIEAATNGISINALRGERTMFFADNYEKVMAQLGAMISFNQSLPNGVSLAGIKYDVEPYLTKAWKAGGADRLQVMNDYLTALELVRAELDKQSSRLELSVDVPFWWDKPEYTFEFAGKEKKFVEHIQGRTDWIGIMSYRREAKDVLRFCESEIAYAQATDASVAIGLNAIETGGSEAVTTFFGFPPKSFRATLADLRKDQAQSKSVRLIMLHDYRAFSEYLGSEKR